MKLTKLLPFLLAVIISLGALAQKNFTKEADAAFEGEAYFSSIELYKRAYAKEPSRAKKAEILFKIAECYRHIVDMKQAETWYSKAIKAQFNDPVAQLHLADAIKAQERYDEALAEYQKYKELNSSDPRGDNGVKSCNLSQKWKDNPTRFEVHNEVLLNSKFYDFSPCFTDKKYKTLIFTSTREGSTGESSDTRTGENYSDLYFTQRDQKGKWSVPIVIDGGVNTEHNEGSSAMNRKYNMLYFTRCIDDKEQHYACKIWTSQKMGNTFGEPVALNLGSDTVTVGHPSVSGDDKYLFFAADLAGGQGSKDIWFVTWDKKAKAWGDPVNPGPNINTRGDDLFPYVHTDGSLYFSSDGHVGMGGLDLFKAEKKGEGQWGKAQNLMSPINSSANDFGIVFEKEKRGYLTSNRAGGKGGDDIYSFFIPSLVFALQGNITNVVTGEPIEAASIKLIGSDGSSYESTSDATGFYEFTTIGSKKDRYIKENTSYQIFVTKEQHLNAKGEETTVGVEVSTTFVHDFALQKFVAETPEEVVEIEFPEVQYDLAKWELRAASKDSLNYLYQTLIDNPTLVIELSAHTDSRSSNKYNMNLSQKRAQSCVDYLIGKGIDSERLLPKGYGEERLLILDREIGKLPTKEEQEAAHQKNRRTVFSVIKDDYVPKEQ
ncbi:MAG: hypothetical protein COA57_09895 [Flavobacteriales bacterium]|nr:MAG: hypothetical protein COA57_09895 [Flavobacteriales bacterium]